MKKTWYCWRILKDSEFISPWDNREDDSALNKFDTADQAHESIKNLINRGSDKDKAWINNWTLCRVTVETLEKRRATLRVVNENGQKTRIAVESFYVNGIDNETIERTMINRYWDPRLTSASCSPDVLIEEIHHA